MQTDRYTKVMLTIIAAALSIQTFQSISIIPQAKADQFGNYNSLGFIPLNDDGSINVKMSAYDEMDVVIKGIETYDQLKVNLSDVSTNDLIRVDLAEINAREELDVNIDEIGGSFVPMGGPIKVELD